jgi:uncharacterized protein
LTPMGRGLSFKIMIVPMFPLPGVFLFPGALLPLHVFEPRYRSMIEDLLDTAGRLVMATVRQEDRHALADSPPVFEVAGLGEIVGHERLPDGRFLVALLGVERVRLLEVASSKLYRLADALPFAENAPAPGDGLPLRREVEDALATVARQEGELSHEVPLARLVDMLLLSSNLPESLMLEAFGSPDVEHRARIALAARRGHKHPES